MEKNLPAWRKWVIPAVCLCLVLAIALLVIFRQPPTAPNSADSPGLGPPSLTVDDVNYIVSPYPTVFDALPEGFTLAGEADIWGTSDCPYYTNPNVPEWVYVYEEVTTDGTLDEYGVLNKTEPHGAYVRYVHNRLRGKDLICYQGEYYISMWSAEFYGDFPDVTQDYWNEMLNTYDIRIEGSVPEGFVSAGIAEFSGHDTIPRGALASNEGEYEIFVNPSEPNVVLAPTQWHSAPVDEGGEVSHSGFNVYIRYDCPFD